MELQSDSRLPQIEKILHDILEQGRNWVFEHEIYGILRLLGCLTPESAFVTNRAELSTFDPSSLPGGRVVCKLISTKMAHRFEHGGVRFVEKSSEALARTFDEFETVCGTLSIPLSGMMIAEEIRGTGAIQNQLLLSMRQDFSFGPVVFLGLGGVGTEVYKDYIAQGKDLVIRAASHVADSEGTERALDRTLFYPVLTAKTRIKPDPEIDGGKVHRALSTFALLAETFSPTSNISNITIDELEINPIQVTPDGDFYPLDALMRISRNRHEPHHPSQKGIRSLLEPESVLILGASANKMNTGRIILGNILREGIIPKDRIFVLHPKAVEIDGCRAFSSLEDIPERVDMTVFAFPANETTADLLERIIEERRSRAVTLIPGGFGETERGKELDRRLQEAIRKNRENDGDSTVINGPNCLGIVSKPGGYNTFFLPEYKLPFKGKYGENSAIISQSGAYLVTLVSNMAQLLNPKYMITYGNQMDLTVTDYLIYMKNDPGIDLFCLYLEGFKPYDGERFLKVAGEILASGKQIIMYKTGRTKAGAAAVASHTASMAGDYEVLHQILTDIGVIIPDTLEEVEDTIKMFTLLYTKTVRGGRIGILANAGFECSVAADRLYSMELARFGERTLADLKKALPTEIIDVRNPVDTTPLTNAVNYGKCLEAMTADGGVDCIVAANVAATPFMVTLPRGDNHGEDISREDSYPNITIDVFRKTDKPMIVSLDSGKLYDPAIEMMEDAGIPCFRKIDRAMKALDVFLRNRMRS